METKGGLTEPGKKPSVGTSTALARSIERGKLIASKIESLKETLAKNSSTIGPQFAKSSLARRELEQSVVFPVESKVPMRETVIETADGEAVKKKIESFITGLKPESQQNAFDDSLLFCDPEFTPENAIRLPTDPDFDKTADFSRVKWKRVKDIASNPLICGFDSLPTSSREIPHKSQIIQGLLGDNWFLSALSGVFHHDYLWKNLTGGDRFDKYREYGLYAFRFFKDNKSFHVIIDDKLPVVERSTGELVPVFARCANPNLFWVSLVEKAYAKLHYRYAGLHNNGTIEDALYDLTGLNPESIAVDPAEHLEIPSDAQKFVDALKVLALSGTCLLTCVDLAKCKSMNISKFAQDCEAAGLLQNYWYHLNDVRELPESEDKPVPTHKLVRIQSPWALSHKKWNGPFSEKDPRWTEGLKKRFNQLYLEQRNRYGEEVFSHDFDEGAKGISIVPLEEYAKRFNTLITVRDFPTSYNGIEYEGAWMPSYGHPNVKSTGWMNNQHYVIRISRKTGELTPVTFLLQQKDPRFLYNEPAAKMLSVGLVILSMSPTEDDVKFYDSKRTIGFAKPVEARFIHWEGNLGNGKYCVVPVTKNAGDVGPYFFKTYYGCLNDEITFSKGGFKVIMEIEKEGGNSGRVADSAVSAKMVKKFTVGGRMAKWSEKVLTPFSLEEVVGSTKSRAPTLTSPVKPSAVKHVAKTEKTDFELRFYDPKLDKEKEYVLDSGKVQTSKKGKTR